MYYFDNSATTRVDERVLEAMLPYLKNEFGNAGSIHSMGQVAQDALDSSRNSIARHLNCASDEIYFTSGATESNNLVLRGVAELFLAQKKPIHIITSAVEHPSVARVCQDLAKHEMIEVDYCPVDEHGIVKIDKLEKLIKENTVLVSIMYANNEVGSVQPIREIATLLRKYKQYRDLPLYFHTDAVQAMNYLSVDVKKLGVDALTFSGHKIYSLKGIGGLFLSKEVKIKPLFSGGHQESGLRPGTENIPAIAGLAKAVDLIASERESNFKNALAIKQKIKSGLSEISDIKFNGDHETALPNIVNVSFKKAEGESLLMLLDMDGICVSTGSACSSGSLEPSAVLTAMGLPPEWSHGSIRISIGKFNTLEEAEKLIESLKNSVTKLRQMAP